MLLLRPLGVEIGESLSFYTLFIAPLQHGHQFMYNLGTWFVIPLFIILIANNLLHKLLSFTEKRTIILFFVYLLLGIISVQLAKAGFNRGWFLLLTKTMFLLPMFGLGLIYRRFSIFDSIKTPVFLLLLMVAQYIIILKFGGIIENNIAWMEGFRTPSIYPFIVEFIGIFFWLRVSSSLTPILKDVKIVNLIGSHTFEIMTHHLFAMMLIKAIFAFVGIYFSLGFDYYKFTHEIFYYYCPKGVFQAHFFYALFGILLPIVYVNAKEKLILFSHEFRNRT